MVVTNARRRHPMPCRKADCVTKEAQHMKDLDKLETYISKTPYHSPLWWAGKTKKSMAELIFSVLLEEKCRNFCKQKKIF